jgi:hypothetical protein
MASPEGLEPPTSDLEGRCSIQLSYGLRGWPQGAESGLSKRDGRGGGIRTHDHLVPNQVRYQAALRPEQSALYSVRGGRQHQLPRDCNTLLDMLLANELEC